ncbi:hypothetical protein ACH5RR_013142 [Cinchona calisaya]|uniref:Uncharacterized protein n=1 Tax=Cinchona calisaya TaxID=153742 RepID=A0ABD3A2H5_9GENT
MFYLLFNTRERTVAFLISSGASPGAFTYPALKYPLGRTPADLASSNGHKGIAGYLDESALSFHLSLIKVEDDKDDSNEVSRVNVLQRASEQTVSDIVDGDLPGLSLKDSLATVHNATETHSRIHQVFGVLSFERNEKNGYGDSKLGMSEERAFSLCSRKTKTAGQNDELVHVAATRIQNKFCS